MARNNERHAVKRYALPLALLAIAFMFCGALVVLFRSTHRGGMRAVRAFDWAVARVTNGV